MGLRCTSSVAAQSGKDCAFPIRQHPSAYTLDENTYSKAIALLTVVALTWLSDMCLINMPAMNLKLRTKIELFSFHRISLASLSSSLLYNSSRLAAHLYWKHNRKLKEKELYGLLASAGSKQWNFRSSTMLEKRYECSVFVPQTIPPGLSNTNPTRRHWATILHHIGLIFLPIPSQCHKKRSALTSWIARITLG